MMPNIFVFHNPQVCLLKTKLYVIFILITESSLTLLKLYHILPKISRHIGFCKFTDIFMQHDNANKVMKKIQN